MRLHVIPSPFYAANGLVLVPSGAGTALVVDPSAGIQHLIREVLEFEGVSVGGVLLTHGHPDHVWDAAAVSTWGPDGATVPVYVPGPDMYRMDDPASFLPMPLPDFVGEWVKPTDLREAPSDSFEVCPCLRTASGAPTCPGATKLKCGILCARFPTLSIRAPS